MLLNLGTCRRTHLPARRAGARASGPAVNPSMQAYLLYDVESGAVSTVGVNSEAVFAGGFIVGEFLNGRLVSGGLTGGLAGGSLDLRH